MYHFFVVQDETTELRHTIKATCNQAYKYCAIDH